jgi:hypothetical protein
MRVLVLGVFLVLFFQPGCREEWGKKGRPGTSSLMRGYWMCWEVAEGVCEGEEDSEE